MSALVVLLVCGLVQGRLPLASNTAVFARSLGRPLSWDRYGAYALDVEGPLPKADQAIIEDVMSGALANAELLARKRLTEDGNDPLPAWVLGQVFRVMKSGQDEYRRHVEKRIDSPGSPALLLYRLQVCRVAQGEAMLATKGQDQSTIKRLDREMATLRERCLPFAQGNLGLAIGITLVPGTDVLSNRRLWETYCRAHPRGLDARPMLCQSYNIGVIYGKRAEYTYPDGHVVELHRADEPQPQKALEIARLILKDRPDDALGHFHAGRSYVVMKKMVSASKEFEKALETGKLPPIYEDVVRAFLDHPSPNVFSPDVPY